MENIFIWKWEKNSENKKHLAIYKDNKLFGIISNLEFTGIAKINDRYFSLETEGSFFKQKTYISDPKNKTKLGQVVFYSDRSYHLEVNDKSKYKLTKGIYFNDPYYTEITNDRAFLFSTSGTIKIFSDNDIELLIYCGFLANTLNSSE